MAEEQTPTPEEEAATPAEEPAPETGSPAQEAPAAPTPEAASTPSEALTPKQRRQRRRAAKAPAARSQMTPQERQAERDAQRLRKAAVRRARRRRERERAGQRRSGGPTPEPLAPLRPAAMGQLKTRQGIVVSDRAAKTITVRIDVARRHPRYEKVVRTSRTLHAHDEKGDAHIGDTVLVRESRPLSRTKRWRLVEVLERAK
jgi:small subunit ribosomal protein S17